MAVEIQREVGGNLAEVLQTVADTMLARNRLKGEIKALTAEGPHLGVRARLAAVRHGSVPVDHQPRLPAAALRETLGLIAIGIGLLLMAMGMLWLRKIVDIEV
jgi:tight adherence protein B